MSLATFWTNTDPKVLAAIIGGVVLLLNQVIGSFVNLLIMKRKVEREIGKRWNEMQMERVSNNLDPLMEKIAETMGRAEKAVWGNLAIRNEIKQGILGLEKYVPETRELVMYLRGLEGLLGDKLPSSRGLLVIFKSWRMRRKKMWFIKSVQSVIANYRGKWN